MRYTKHIVTSLLLCLVCAFSLRAQDKAVMADYQSQLQALFEEVYAAPTDNQRYHANESAVNLMAEALAENNSIRWTWDFGTKVSVLTAPDKKFRIFSWPVINDAGEYECFGFVQALNEKTDEYDLYILNDKSQEIINRQEDVLAHDRWYGCVYQELITTSHDGKTFYTLLGWTGVDNLTQRKIIEPVCFKSTSSAPIFGQSLFKNDRNLRRVVLEYKHDAMVNLWYEEQYVRTVERIRAKRTSSSVRQGPPPRNYNPKKRKKGKKGSSRPSRVVVTAKQTSKAQQERVTSGPTQKVSDEKMKMIIFDEVGPQIPGMEGLFQYYVPSGVELSYVFINGKWVLREGAQGRVQNKKLNKDFDKPIEKEAPAYQYISE